MKKSLAKALEEHKKYLDSLGVDLKKKKKDEREEQDEKYIFDQVMADKKDKMYCQKSKYESVWDANVRPREPPKNIQSSPTTTN